MKSWAARSRPQLRWAPKRNPKRHWLSAAKSRLAEWLVCVSRVLGLPWSKARVSRPPQGVKHV